MTEAPDPMREAEGTAAFTEAGGGAIILAAIDHCTPEYLGIHAVHRATRFESLEPIRQGWNTL